MFQKKIYSDIIFIVFFIPAIFINTPNMHNWGGDFAQYINQAKCIVEGKTQTETGYIYNDEIPVIGPPAYPVGFSILLSPIYLIYGNNISVYILFMGILLFILGIVFFFFFLQYMKGRYAFLFSALLIYNPWTLSFKGYLMTDIPFTIVLLLGFIIIKRENMNKIFKLFLLSIIAGVLILFKTIGILFSLSVLSYYGYIFISNTINWKKSQVFLKKIGIFLSFLVVFIFFVNLLIPIPKGGSYLDQVHFASLWKSSLVNLNYYTNLSFNFFPLDYASSVYTRQIVSQFPFLFKLYEILSLILRSFLFVALILGIYKSIISKKYELSDFLFVFYFIFIVLWPSKSGFRYLLPIFPILLLYIYNGRTLFSLNLKSFYLVFLIILILPTYLTSAYLLNKPKNIDGPQIKNAEEVFKYIKNNTDENSVVVFWKPRVAALYTERKSLVHDFSLDFEKLEKKYKIKSNNLYYLRDKYLDNRIVYETELNKFSVKTKEMCDTVFSNNRFILYKLKK